MGVTLVASGCNCTFVWTQLEGASVDLANGTSGTASLRAPAPGSHVVLRVTGTHDGKNATATVQLVVRAPEPQAGQATPRSAPPRLVRAHATPEAGLAAGLATLLALGLWTRRRS